MKIIYIDSQNVQKGTQENGWLIDWGKFYVYVKEKYKVDEIKVFFGYMKKYNFLYKKLEKIGFNVYFKNVMVLPGGNIKGNVDVDIAVISMADFFEGNLSEFYLVSGDGDFNTLIDFFTNKKSFGKVLVPNKNKISRLLKISSKNNLIYLDDLRGKIKKVVE